MKKYFTKYLPVEGEIKDKVLWNGMIHDVYGESLTPNVTVVLRKIGTNREEVYLSDCKPVKLFLCTSEIEFNDTLFHADGTPITQEEKNKYGRNEILVWRSAGCYKVVGEVSPEAVWVLDKFDFTEDQIKPIYWADTVSLKPPYTVTPGKIHIIKILCPTCKTFH